MDFSDICQELQIIFVCLEDVGQTEIDQIKVCELIRFMTSAADLAGMQHLTQLISFIISSNFSVLLMLTLHTAAGLSASTYCHLIWKMNH